MERLSNMCCNNNLRQARIFLPHRRIKTMKKLDSGWIGEETEPWQQAPF